MSESYYPHKNSIFRQSMLKDMQDAQGHIFYDYFRGRGAYEIVERDDGYFDVGNPALYFAQYGDWPEIEKRAMKHCSGRVLDIGCGAGRHAIYLQEQGFGVVGIDNSPLAVETSRLRGLRDVRGLSIGGISPALGVFDTILMLGNNFGLFGSLNGGRRLLRKLDTISSADARIIAETPDPHNTVVPEHLTYHKLNERRGRLPGQIKIRVRYRKYVTPWFDYLFVSKEEMAGMLKGTVWKVQEFIEGEGPVYIAIMVKDGTKEPGEARV
jgi:SAM-dependent methyltransferase